ncbi:hypothetical protein NDU88_001373 [Pleurodeles waltl]|uniref:Uncharacterized protein n=1 Tax=Pleurodeles waltl TaxID=8319 RepID=A0AAV7PCD1_PLEWA|nr:hypothetical protein NDU88_001373 [Pleurodeles waltl]
MHSTARVHPSLGAASQSCRLCDGIRTRGLTHASTAHFLTAEPHVISQRDTRCSRMHCGSRLRSSLGAKLQSCCLLYGPCASTLSYDECGPLPHGRARVLRERAGSRCLPAFTRHLGS